MRHPADYLDTLKRNVSLRGGHVDVTPESNELNAQLEAPLEALDLRPRRMLAPGTTHEQQFNLLYNSLLSRDVIDNIADIAVTGSIAITNATSTPIPITMPANAKAIAVRKWPDGTQFYFLIRHFSIMATTTGAVGDWQCTYSDTAGNIIPLGDINAASGQTLQPNAVCPASVTDSGIQALGSINVNWLGGAAPVTVGYTIGFSVLFLLPAKHQYKDKTGYEQHSSYLD